MKFRPRTRKVRVFQGDDEAALDELRDQIAEARRTATKGDTARRMGQSSDLERLVEEYNARLAAAEAESVEFLFTALSRPRWKALVEAHPPTEGDEAQEATGVNEDTFAPALVVESVLTRPPGDEDERPTREELEEFVDCLSSGQLDHLYGIAFTLNRMAGASPKSLSVTELTTSSDATRR